MSDRPLPLVEAPVALASPRVARLLLDSWDRAVTPALRTSGEAVPPELEAFIEACRIVGARQSSGCGTAVDVGEEMGAGSGDGETTSSGQQPRTTAEEAGRRLGCTGRHVRNLARAGRLRASKVGGVWLVDPASIESYRAARAASG